MQFAITLLHLSRVLLVRGFKVLLAILQRRHSGIFVALGEPDLLKSFAVRPLEARVVCGGLLCAGDVAGEVLRVNYGLAAVGGEFAGGVEFGGVGGEGLRVG